MTTLRLTSSATKTEIANIARLHKRAFPAFFLSQLGTSFLKTLYRGYIADDASGIVVAEDDGSIVGFAAYSNDYSAFFRKLLKRKLFPFAFSAACAAVRHPRFIKRLLKAFRKSGEVERTEAYVELSSICVEPALQGRGIGSMLLEYFQKNVDFSRYAYINLETDAENNDAANSFYRKNGFVLTRRYVTGEGRAMNEYRYTPTA